MKIERDERSAPEEELSHKRKTTDLLTPVSEELGPATKRSARGRSSTGRASAKNRRSTTSERRETHSTNSARFIAQALESHHKRTGRQVVQKPAPEGPGWPFRIGLILAALGILVFMATFIFSESRPVPPPLPLAKARSPREARPGRGPRVAAAPGRRKLAPRRVEAGASTNARLPQRSILEVAGRVVEEGGYGVPGARLRLLAADDDNDGFRGVGQPVRSEREGAFSLRGTDDALLLEVKATGFATRIVPLSGQEVAGLAQLEIILTEAKTIDGVVVEAESGEPIAGARIRGESASWRGEQTSQADGRFLFDDVPAESINLFITAADRVPAVADGRSGTTVALLRGRLVRGIVVDKAQVPVPGASVVVIGNEHPALPRRTRSDRDGRFLVKGIGPNEEVLVLARTSILATPNREDWQPADRSSLRIQVLPMARALIVGEVDRSLHLAPGLSLGASESKITGEVTPEGVLFDGLPAGSYRVLRGQEEVGERVDLEPGRTARIRLPSSAEPAEPPSEGEASLASPVEAIEDGGEVDVRVLDERDRPLTSASVFVDSGLNGRSLYRTKTDASGRATVPRVSTRLLITAEFPGRMLKRAVEVGPSGSQVTLMLLKPARLVGEVRPSAVTSVTLIDVEQGQPVREIVTGEDGRFRFEDLVPGSYALEFQADGFQIGKRQVTLPVIGDYLRLDMTPGGEEHALPEHLRDLKDPEKAPDEGKG